MSRLAFVIKLGDHGYLGHHDGLASIEDARQYATYQSANEGRSGLNALWVRKATLARVRITPATGETVVGDDEYGDRY